MCKPTWRVNRATSCRTSRVNLWCTPNEAMAMALAKLKTLRKNAISLALYCSSLDGYAPG